MGKKKVDKLNIIKQEEGAKATSVYTERKIKIFPVTEAELNSVSNINDLSIVFFSIGSFILNIYIQNLREPPFEKYNGISDPLVYITAIFFGVGVIALFKRTGLVDKIKKGSDLIDK